MDYSEFDPHSMAAAVAQNRRLLGMLPQDPTSWDVTDCGQLDFEVDIEKLLAETKARDIEEYNAWCSIIGTFIKALADKQKENTK